MQLLRLHLLPRLGDHAIGHRQHRRIGVGECAWLGQHAVKLPCNHRQRALRQVAEIIGEVGIDAVDDRLQAVIAVLPKRNFTQEKIAHLVDPIGVHQRERVDHVADRLRHLLAAIEQKSV